MTSRLNLLSLCRPSYRLDEIKNKIKVLCEQIREANKRIKIFSGLCLILFGFGNTVADFHV